MNQQAVFAQPSNVGGLPVDQELARLSDLAFMTSFGFYTVALLLMVIFYASVRTSAAALSEQAIRVGSGTVNHLPEPKSTDYVVAPKPSSKLARIGLLFTAIALVFHIGSLVLRGLATGRVPWGNMYEFVTLTCAVGVAAGFYFLRSAQWRPLWPFLLTPILGLMFFAGTKLYSEAAPVVPALRSYWLPVHVSIISLSAGIFLVSGVASLLYLLRIANPVGSEGKRWGWLVRPLPSATALDKLAYSTAIIAFPIFGIGVICGAIWAETAWGRFWGWDPKETMSFVTWVIYAGYLHARATAGWKTARAAWINVVGFLAMLFNLFLINMVISGLHSYAGLS